MKYKQLQKKLAKAGIICGIVILICGGIFFFANKLSQDKQAEIEDIESKANIADGNYKVLEMEYDESIKAIKFYESNDIEQNEDQDSFRRESARRLLSGIKDNIGLPDLKFSMEQFKKIPSTPERLVALYSSSVKVEFTANSDIDAFNLIVNIIKTFPGQVAVVSYEVEKSSDISPDVFERTISGELKGIVRGTVQFSWNSIRDNDTPPPAQGAEGMPNGMQPPGRQPMPSQNPMEDDH